MKTLIYSLLMSSILFAGTAHALDDWTQQFPDPHPSARRNHTMAYIGGDKVLLFGGYDAALDDETWVYDLSDTTWTEQSPSSKPSARDIHAMAYIGADKVILFGGDDGALDDETWVYDLSANNWIQKFPDPHPSARRNHDMAYIGGDQVLLFGGDDGVFYDETWVYDLSANTWSQKTPASKPSGRSHHIMAYTGGDQVLLFGGYDGSEDAETWVYDLSVNTWTQKFLDPHPSARHRHAMAYIGGDQVLLFGGYDGSADAETWVYDLGDDDWTQDANTTQPSPRYRHGLSESSMDGASFPILFGGYDGSYHYDDTWTFGGGDYPMIDTIHVPGDQPTIQLGLDAAGQGAIVLVQPDTYVENIVWPSVNGVKLLSAGDSSNTIIDGNNAGNVVKFPAAADVDTTTVIRGFKITNGGNVRYGGGIFCEGSNSPTIQWNMISRNGAEYGGGIYCDSFSVARIEANTIANDTATSSGSAIYLDFGSSPKILGNNVCQNFSNEAAITVSKASWAIISGNTFTRNITSAGDGTIHCSYVSSPTISKNIIAWNRVGNNGGGIYCYYPWEVKITGNKIIGNRAEGSGGGIFFWDYYLPHTSVTCTSNVIAEDTAYGGSGGGIYCRQALMQWKIAKNTVTRNHATGNGGAFCCVEASNIKFTHNTVTENTADSLGDGIYKSDDSGTSTDTISYCNIAFNCHPDSAPCHGWALWNAHYQSVPAAQNNWWGNCLPDTSGPWHETNPDGQGDSLSIYAWDFTPWLNYPDTIAPPIPPRDLTIVTQYRDSVTISWLNECMGDLAGYRVYYDNDSSGFPYSYWEDAGLDTTYTLDLYCGDIYYVAVTSYDNLGEESWYSKEIEVGDRIPPDPVDDLTATLDSGVKSFWGNVYLSWSESHDNVGVKHYVVCRSNTPYQLGDSLALTTDTEYLDVGVVGNLVMHYYYTVKAVDGCGNKSPASNQVGEFDRLLER